MLHSWLGVIRSPLGGCIAYLQNYIAMGTYLYELPTTGAISFADFCLDERALYTAYIAEATQARANLRGALKESKRDHGEKDYLKLIKVRCPIFESYVMPLI